MAIFATQKSDGSVTLPVNVVLFASYVLLILIVSLSVLFFLTFAPLVLHLTTSPTELISMLMSFAPSLWKHYSRC
jgi:hypothetical protein